ncbi:hypothetical protein M8C21_015272 [Ambrosia artemisiifolia]|uniref:Thioredoxin domain-containing protein n=1 Tax=Ambrosia artemisiifolia TaxID=4212 RepID=A0AAD5BRK6_AMBAR|nr:hypothetical protein M8C21_015272 [Ambrosia artemisiifolia]
MISSPKMMDTLMASSSSSSSSTTTIPRRPPLPPLRPSNPFLHSLPIQSFRKQPLHKKLNHSLHNYSPSFSSFALKFSIKCGVTEINETQFPETVLKCDRPVLVEFVAAWCGPCRLIAPAIEAISKEYEDKLLVVKIDHDANPKLIEEYKVYGLPALIMFKDGKEIAESRREGAITKAKLKDYIDALLQSLSVA